MSATNLIYGLLLKRFRIKKGFTQKKLAKECYIARATLVNFESGRHYPNRCHREAFAQALNSPVLEYFPQYNIEQFPERLRIRFQAEKDASRFLNSNDLSSLNDIFNMYQQACRTQSNKVMMNLDESLHTIIMDAHPDKELKQTVTRYTQDFIELFKIWIPLLDLDIVRKLESVHFEIFESILNQNQNQIDQSFEHHLDNSLNDVQEVINLLENKKYS